MYVGHMDGIQLKANKMWDRLGNIEAEVREQSTLIRGVQVKVA